MSDNRRARKRQEAAGAELSFSAWLRTWRYFFIFLGVVVAVGLFYAEENWRGERAWETHKHGLEVRGEPSDGAALVPPAVSDDQNFAMAPFLLAAFTQRGLPTGFSPWYDRATKDIKAEKPALSNSWALRRTDLGAWYAAFLGATNAARREALGVKGTNFNFTGVEAAAGVLAGLAECEPILEELRQAGRRPFCRFNLAYDQQDPLSILLPHLSTLKHLSLVLRLRASAELVLGRTGEALGDIDLMFRLAEAAREEPIRISQSVRMAQFHLALQPLVQGLADHQWSEGQLRALEARLRRFDFCADGRRALEGECLFFGCRSAEFLRQHPEAYGMMKSGVPSGQGGGPGAGLVGVLIAIAPGGWFDFEKRNYSRLFHESILPALDVAHRRISPALCAKGDQNITALGTSSGAMRVLRHRLLSDLLGPECSGFLSKVAFAQTAADTTAIACALERYRLAQGRFPETLDALGPQWPGRLPPDIINGQPLKYHRSGDDHFTLYSVGWNQTDDGGQVQLKPGGEAVDWDRGDWVFR